MLSGLVPSQAVRDSVPGLSPGTRWSLALLGAPGLLDTSPGLCLPRHMVLSLCGVSVSIIVLLADKSWIFPSLLEKYILILENTGMPKRKYKLFET